MMGFKSNLAFLFSNWYSGATMLAFFLNNHSDLICNGETFPFKYDEANKHVYICSCGKHIRQCDFYSKTTLSFKTEDTYWNEDFRILPNVAPTKMLNKVICSFNRHVWLRDLLLVPGSPLRTRLNRYLAAHMQFCKRALAYYDASCYVDGTKSMRRAEIFIQYGQERTKVIYLIRDGRGFCRSFLKNQGHSTEQFEKAAIAWKEHIDLVGVFRMRYPSIDILLVRYEDLCRDLTTSLRRICDFLEIEFESDMVGQPTNHHLFGNRMRLNFDGNIKEDLSWKEYFSINDIEKLNDIMQPELERYGYI